MVANKRLNYISLPIFCFILMVLQINSTVWFRMKLADYYKSRNQYLKAIQVYNKILTKNSVKRDLGEETFSRINFDLGYLYARLNLNNLAIESYARGNAKFPEADLGRHCSGKELDKDRLIAIGLLEAARWDKAIEEFRRLKQLYPQFQDAERYIDTAIELNRQDFSPDDNEFYFAIGEAYIQNQLFDEARAYFSKRILDYGIDPLPVLRYLQKRYSEKTEIKQRVWGKDIYVTLEDFETIEPRLNRWESSVMSKVNNHYIARETVYEGNYSEFLDITHTQQSQDYWAKTTRVQLNDRDLNLGIRLYIKSTNHFRYDLGINLVYPRPGTTGFSSSADRREIGGGWQELRIENLFKRAEGIAARPSNRWDMEGLLIDKIILDTRGGSSKFFIDSIELYLWS